MLINIQFLRFVAALMVVLYHGAAHLRTAGHDPGWLFGFGESAGFAGVDIFFVISGFIMAWTTESVTGADGAVNFAKRRVARIYSGYWPFYLMALILFTWLSPQYLSNVDFTGSALLWPTDLHHLLIPVSWTLIFEMGFYALFTVLIAATGPGRDRVIVFLLIATLGWALFSQFVRGAYEPGRLEDMSVYEQYLAFPFLLEFLAGSVLAAWLRKHPQGPALVPLAAGVTLFVAGGWINQNAFGGALIQGYHVLWRVLIFGGGSVMILAGLVRLESRGAVFPAAFSILAGGSSYALYLSHTLILDAAGRLGMKGFLSQNPDWLAKAALAGVCLAIVLYSMAHYRWLERPLHHLFRRWLRA